MVLAGEFASDGAATVRNCVLEHNGIAPQTFPATPSAGPSIAPLPNTVGYDIAIQRAAISISDTHVTGSVSGFLAL